VATIDNLNKGHRQRLRERFLKGGEEAVADYELLEMILFAAHPRGDVKPLAKKLLKQFGSFAKVLNADVTEYAAVDGVGEGAIASLKAVKASSARMLKEKIKQGPIISNWTSLLNYCEAQMAHKKVEEFRILFLNNKNELIADEAQQQGTINHTSVYPREVIKRALELGVSSIILCHNHPSGDTTPSQADIDMTRQIINAGLPLSINVHDHLIIGKHGHYSFKSQGLI